MSLLIDTLKKNVRYKDFVFFNEPKFFDEFFSNISYDVVQIHDMTPVAHTADIIGFAGVFQWKNNKITPLDGDSYAKHMPMWGYSAFEKNGEKCLDILVEEW